MQKYSRDAHLQKKMLHWRYLVLWKELCFIGTKWGTGVSGEGLAWHIP